jgi:hypothetical protein
MLFRQSLVANSRTAQQQWQEVQEARNAFRFNENRHAEIVRASGMRVNTGLIPQDVYQELDNVTVERFSSDEGDTILNDLLPLSRSVSIGRLVHKFRRASDAGIAQTSMTGQIGINIDQTEYTYDGTIIPIHDTGYGRNWREWAAQTAEGFDALIDDQREHVSTLRRRYVDTLMDGVVDKDGNYIVVDGISWQGMRNDARVAKADLGAAGVNFDFTDQTQAYADIEAAFKQVRDVLWITNNSQRESTVYVSREIGSNLERNSSESYESKKIVERLAGLQGVAAIKTSSKLTGNEFMMIPLDGVALRPIVGMGINTVPMPRPLYNSNYNFAVWGACGFEARTDYYGRKATLMALALT